MAFSPQEARFLQGLTEQIAALERMIDGLKMGGDSPVSNENQHQGRPIPYTLGVNIDIPGREDFNQQGHPNPSTALNNQEFIANITMTADGPFIAKRVHFAWKQTEHTNTHPAAGIMQTYQKFLQISSLKAFLPWAFPFTFRFQYDLINFYWEYYLSGSQRKRQNIPVPSACVDVAEEGAGFWEMCVNDVFPKTSTVTFKIKPTALPNRSGVLYCGFHGFYVLEG